MTLSSMYDHRAVVGFENGKCQARLSIANLARHRQSSRSDGTMAVTAEIFQECFLYINGN